MIIQVLAVSLIVIHAGQADDTRNHHPHHRNSLMTMKDLTDHWIGMPKSPYVHYTATISPTTSAAPSPTSAPIRPKMTTKAKPKKKRKPTKHSKRRSDSDESPYHKEDNYMDKDPYPDFEYDYDSFDPSYGGTTSPTPYIMRNPGSSPRTVYMNPSGSSPSVSAIFAGVPKIATYVVPSAKKYVVQRVNSHTMYVPPASSQKSKMYAAASASGVRRIDPMDYDDNGGGSFAGPQSSFPPRPVMNKITEAGGRQPCHGPECHQHHKGLVRFYWRRVVYPDGRRGRPTRFRRPQRLRNRRRFRDRDRSPSDQKELYAPENDEDLDEEPEDKENYDDQIDDEMEEEEGDEDEDSTNRRNTWRPGRGYGHDLHEGRNYNDHDKRIYRDKRYAYKRRMRNHYQ